MGKCQKWQPNHQPDGDPTNLQVSDSFNKQQLEIARYIQIWLKKITRCSCSIQHLPVSGQLLHFQLVR